VEIKALKYWKI